MADIFLSYSREDEDRAKGLVSEFEGQGWSVFWDRRIPAGETWRSHIGSAIENARCIVVAWSVHSIESQWVAEEADEGKTRSVLVPVLLDRVQPPRGFREIQAADLSEWQPGERSERLTELIGDLQRLLGTRAESRKEKQHPERPATPEREAVSPSGSRPHFSLRAIGAALLSLLAIAMVGYFVGRPLLTDKASIGPAPTQSQPEQTPALTTQTGSWLIVAGSFARSNRSAADQRRVALVRAGLEAAIVDSNDYSLLAPNLWVAAVGPFESREAANTALPQVTTEVPDAYVKKGR